MPTIQILGKTEIQGFLNTHVEHIFNTMFAMPVTTSPTAAIPQSSERVCGSVGFGGDNVNGAVYLHLPAKFASVLAGAMLGMQAEEASELEVNDVVGELSNMLAGGLKAWLTDAGFPCAGSTPAVIRGNSFAIEASEAIERFTLFFAAGYQRFSVEIHIQQQPQPTN